MSFIGKAAGFLGFSSLGASQKAQIREEISLMDAINAHVKWKVRLEDYLNGTSKEKLDAMVICRDDQCALGKWIHGSAVEHFHTDVTFQQLRSDHAQFHFVAGSVVRHVQAREHEEAAALMDGAYKQASRKVVQALTELNQHISD